MSKRINCAVIDRATSRLVSSFTSYEWEVNRDYLTNERSRFAPVQEIVAAKPGDFFVAKTSEGFNVFFCGVVVGVNAGSVTAADLYNLASFQTVGVRLNGPDVITHIREILQQYLLDPGDKNVEDLIITGDGETVPYSYQPNDPPTAMNLTDYLIGCFKKYRAVWQADAVTVNNGKYTINSSVNISEKKGHVKDNLFTVVNWDVLIEPLSVTGENKIVLIDKKTTSLTEPIILDTWFITADGEVTNQRTPDVTLPTREKVYIYDNEATDKPTYESVARAELEASQYSHEILCDITQNNELLDWDWLQIGAKVTVGHQGTLYDSVLTGYTIKSDSSLITCHFGYIRSNLKQVIERLTR